MTVRDRIIELRRIKASELAPDPRNPRRHPGAQRRALQAMLQEIGYGSALLARETPHGGLVLVDGHLRADLDPDQVVPVLVLDVTEAAGAALLATLDPLASMALADPDALAALLAEAALPEDVLAARPWSLVPPVAATGLTDPEAVPERSRRSRVRRGELWALGEHRLLCADATDPTAVRRLMAEERADVLMTDPPYGVGYVGKTPHRLRIANDRPDSLEHLLASAFAAADAVLALGGRVYVFHPAGELSSVFAAAFTTAGWRLHQTLVWVKDRMVLGRSDYHYRHEPIHFGYKPGDGRWGRGARGWYGGNDQDSVLEVHRPAASREHPTAKPVELLRRLLQNSSRAGQIVLDPFAGSGSTLIACQELGRRARLVELDPVYCEVICARYESFTGEKVEVAGG